MVIRQYLSLNSNVKKYFISCFFFAMSSSLVSFLIIILNDLFDFTIMLKGGIYATIMLLMIPSVMIGGKFADRFSKKKLLLMIRSTMVILFFLYGIINNNYAKLIIIALLMVFMGVSNPALDAYVFDICDESNEKESYSLIYFGRNIAGILTPIVTGYMLYRKMNIFYFYALVASMGIIFLSKINCESKEKKHDNNSGFVEKETNKQYMTIIKLICILIAFVCLEFSFAQQSFSLPILLEREIGARGTILYGYITSINAIVLLLATPIITVRLRKIREIDGLIICSLMCCMGFGLLMIYIKTYFILASVFIWSIGEVIYSILAMIYLKSILHNRNGKAMALLLVCRSIGIAGCSLYSSYNIMSSKVNIWLIAAIVSIIACVILWIISYSSKYYAQKIRMKYTQSMD